MTDQNKHQGHRLRRGRVPLPEHVYALTLVTRNRYRWFAEHTHARIAARTLYASALNKYGQTLAFVVMPDHMHWLYHLNDRAELSQPVRIYKAKTSLAIGSSVWQHGFHDRAVRRNEDMQSIARYIVANPLRAKLVTDISGWPYWNAAWL